MCLEASPAHAALPGAGAAGGGGGGLVGPAVVGALQVPDHLQKINREHSDVVRLDTFNSSGDF